MNIKLISQLTDDMLIDEVCKNLGNPLIAELVKRFAAVIDERDPITCPECGAEIEDF